MSKITIKQAQKSDISVLESILLDTVNWLNEIDQPLWGMEDVTWSALSPKYQISDFYIAYLNGNPSGCMALVDYDPFFWPDIKQGESLYIHKLATTKVARKTGVADALIDFFKEQGAIRGVKTLRLDTHALRPKVCAFYERHGFALVEKKIILGKYHTAFYIFSLSDAVNIFLHKSIMVGGLPFDMTVPPYNEETLAAMQEARDIASGKIESKSYASLAELNAELDAEYEREYGN